MNKLVEAFGWYGTCAILTAYLLVSFSLLNADGIWYQALCISGGAGIVAVSLQKKAYQPVVLNVISILIGSAAIANILM